MRYYVPLVIALVAIQFRLFVVRHYWHQPMLDEDPDDVTFFREGLAEFMKNKPILTEDQIKSYWENGFLVLDNFAPKELVALMDKYNKQFKKSTFHFNTFEDYTTKTYMGYIESKIFREWDVNGPLKYVTKQLLDYKLGKTLDGVRLWNELVLATTPNVKGIDFHYDRGSYSLLDDDEAGVSTWVLLANMSTEEYGYALEVLNMTKIPDHCLLESQQGQNFWPWSAVCVNRTEEAIITPKVTQGALIIFDRWTYHRTQPRTGRMPQGFERTLQVARWIQPHAKIQVYGNSKTSVAGKTGGSVGGNKFAAFALGARNYFCRNRVKDNNFPGWLNDGLHGSSKLTSADAKNSNLCAPDVFNGEMPNSYDDVIFSYTLGELYLDWPKYFIGEHYKLWSSGKMSAYETIALAIKNFPMT